MHFAKVKSSEVFVLFLRLVTYLPVHVYLPHTKCVNPHAELYNKVTLHLSFPSRSYQFRVCLRTNNTYSVLLFKLVDLDKVGPMLSKLLKLSYL